MEAVTTHNLQKVYGKHKKVAVNHVSFSVNKGEIFGLIGPDGAGKTSIFRMLTTLLLPDDGTASVNGFDIVKDFREIRKIIGYMPGKFSLYPDLTISENLHFFASVFGTSIAENYDLIEDIYVQIEPFKNRRAGKLSGGMKQKLALCCALIHKPTVLFLDEPTTGVDPVSRKELWDMLRRLRDQEITIVVSTPYMDEASLCDRIALMQEGNILSVSTPENLVKSYPGKLYAVQADNMYHTLQALAQYDKVADSYAFGEYAHVSFGSEDINEMQVVDYLHARGLHDARITRVEPGIEDCFIKLLKS